MIGGGNIFRGAGLASGGMDRVTGDHMGMLATVMNALAMQDALAKLGVPARVMSALSMTSVCEDYSAREARRHLDAGRVTLFAAGTGNPYFTTDSAASLRAVEIGGGLPDQGHHGRWGLFRRPQKDPNAVFYPRLTYDQALREGLAVMDATAIVLCRDNRMPLRVMNMNEPGALMRLIRGEPVGSLVESGD